ACLLDSQLPVKLWMQAAEMCVHVSNRLPQAGLGYKMTPYQALYGEKPSIGYFRPFGTLAITRKPQDTFGKLEARNQKMRLVGYASGK
ncbi:hypothetical protein BC831DRAFT_377369, partial [Entophlyctis helioformis]